MPWVNQRYLDRLESDLTAALQRAEVSESRLAAERERLDGLLAAERQSKDWLTVQLASRVVTKHGQYGLDHEKSVAVEPQPSRYTHEPTEMDYARLEFYKRDAQRVGATEEDAQARWEAEMRGNPIPVAYEMDSEQ